MAAPGMVTAPPEMVGAPPEMVTRPLICCFSTVPLDASIGAPTIGFGARMIGFSIQKWRYFGWDAPPPLNHVPPPPDRQS